MHTVCQLAELEARAVAGGTWQIKDLKKLNGCNKIGCFKLRLNEQTDGGWWIFRGRL